MRRYTIEHGHKRYSDDPIVYTSRAVAEAIADNLIGEVHEHRDSGDQSRLAKLEQIAHAPRFIPSPELQALRRTS